MTTSERITFFSICSREYLAHARCLFRSLREHYPTAKLTLVLIDEQIDPRDLSGDDFDIVLSKNIAADSFYDLTHDYGPEELGAALKPFAFRHFLARDNSPIAYIAPDSFAYSRLDELTEILGSGASIALTPRNIRPIGAPDEAELLAGGTIDPGLIAVAPGAESAAFLTWWCSRVAGRELAGSTPVAHDRWLDLVPNFFDGARIHKHAGYGVACWNILQRPMTRRGASWFADGAPLRLVHFNRLQRDDVGPFRNELESYIARLASCGTPGEPTYPYGLRYEEQQIDSPGLRATLRSLRAAGGGASLKMPAVPDEAIRELLAPPSGLPRSEPFPISRLLYARWAASPKLQAEFPLFDGAQRARFLYWVLTGGHVDLDVAPSLLPWRELSRPVTNPLAKRVQLPAFAWMIWLAEPEVRQSCQILDDMGVVRLLGHLLEDVHMGKRPGAIFQATQLEATFIGEGANAVSVAELALWTRRKDLQDAFDPNTVSGRTALKRWIEQFPRREAPWTLFGFPPLAQVADV